MAIVNALRFDHYSGAMVSDEEFWLLGRRKTYIADSLHSLLDPADADALGLEAIYGGTGHLSFHHEVVTKTKKALAEGASKGKKACPYKTVEQVGRLALGQMQDVARRRIDDVLRFLYGFTVDDLNRGYFEADGKRFEINQEAVRKHALQVVNSNSKSPLTKNVHGNFGVLIGFEPEDGFAMYNLNAEKSVLCHVSGGFETVGSGKYAAGASFSTYLGQKHLQKRRKGFDRVEGMTELIASVLDASLTFQAVGGNFAIVYLDGRGKSHAERVSEVTDARAKLATEVVWAWRRGFLERDSCYELVGSIVYHGEDLDRAEERFLGAVTDRRQVQLLLRGYKVDTVEARPTIQAGRKAVTRRKLGKQR